MSNLIDACRSQEPAAGNPNVLIAGDPEKEHMKKCDSQGGIEYHPNQVKFAVIKTQFV
jgi:LDH2 family malate/lactate/ureidoglycolate dehydrogenase